MLRTSQPLQRFAEYRVWFNPDLITHRFKYYSLNKYIWQSSWRGRAPHQTVKPNWKGTRRVGGIGKDLNTQRAFIQRHLLQENFRKPDGYHREHITTPNVTTMDGVLPKHLTEASASLQARIRFNQAVNRYMDPAFKHKTQDKARFSWLNYESVDASKYHNVYDVTLASYDRVRVEHFQDFVFRTAEYLGMNVDESYALPTTTTHLSDYNQNIQLNETHKLVKHYRIVSLRDLDNIQMNILSNFIKESLPESLEVNIKEHDMANHNKRYERRTDLEQQQKMISELQKVK